jgi:D-serine deaminase-like pyridoxal phosphate-dependent protein
MHVSELETPALIIDLPILERNLRQAAEYSKQHGLRLRPHTKTHKIVDLARRQLSLGADGLTVAKVGEAEVMVAAGPREILIAYPVIGRSKLERLTRIAAETRVIVALDTIEAARQLSEATTKAGVRVGILIEVDVGFGRMGMSPESVRTFAQQLLILPGVTVEGIAFFPGHILEMCNGAMPALSKLGLLVGEVIEDLRSAGVPVRIVSGGSTPTLYYSHLITGMNEIRPGTYLFNDRNTLNCNACSLDECAATVLTTVVSTASEGRIIVDGGSKAFSSDAPVGTPDLSYGVILEAPDAVFYKMNEEHGYINVENCGRSFSVGEKLRIIPNHVCPAVNLYDVIYGVHDGRVEQVWKVDARGKLQ